MYITAFFTNQDIPEEGLTPTIRVRRVSDGLLVVTDDDMDEIGDGWYRYDFVAYNSKINYVIRCDGGDTLPNSDRYMGSGSNDDWGQMFDGNITARETMELLRKIETNRAVITPDDTYTTIFDDDGVTPLQSFEISGECRVRTPV